MTSRSPDHSSEAGSQRAIVAAFLANLGIAAAKFVGFAVTGAASMLAEAIHSVADTGNQGLLLLGRARAQREATDRHPFGHGRERYFWAFVVAVVLFTGGGLFALFEGEEKLRHPHPPESAAWAIGILAVAACFEGLSLRTAVRESRPLKEGRSWWGMIRHSKVPELPVVLLEDTGALVGLLLALVGVAMAEHTGNPRWDAAGSLGIGVLLVAIALVLAVEMKSFLIGESASPDDVAGIHHALSTTSGITRAIHLRTEQLGPEDLLVVAKIAVDPALDAPSLAAVIGRAETAVRSRVPAARLIYLEPDLDRPE